MADGKLPLEAETAKVRRIKGRGVQVTTDKFGRETRIDWPIELAWETEEEDFECKDGKWTPITGRREKSARIYGNRVGLEDLSKVGAAEYVLQTGKYEELLPDVCSRLLAEYDAVMLALQPELEKKRAQLAKSREKRLTGDGAKARIDKALELLTSAFTGVPDGFDAPAFRRLLRIHASGSLFNVLDHRTVTVFVTAETLDQLEAEGVTAEVALRTVGQLAGARGVPDVIQHAASNPQHWDLLTDDHFRQALQRARVLEVMGA